MSPPLASTPVETVTITARARIVPRDHEALVRSLSGGDYPAMKSLIDEVGQVDTDADFEFGLNVLIRGIEAELP